MGSRSPSYAEKLGGSTGLISAELRKAGLLSVDEQGPRARSAASNHVRVGDDLNTRCKLRVSTSGPRDITFLERSPFKWFGPDLVRYHPALAQA